MGGGQSDPPSARQPEGSDRRRRQPEACLLGGARRLSKHASLQIDASDSTCSFRRVTRKGRLGALVAVVIVLLIAVNAIVVDRQTKPANADIGQVLNL